MSAIAPFGVPSSEPCHIYRTLDILNTSLYTDYPPLFLSSGQKTPQALRARYPLRAALSGRLRYKMASCTASRHISRSRIIGQTHFFLEIRAKPPLARLERVACVQPNSWQFTHKASTRSIERSCFMAVHRATGKQSTAPLQAPRAIPEPFTIAATSFKHLCWALCIHSR
ncbi:hypothetical protein DL93DRAFT_412813 [Clavulina sp. PMI_390]|nr:hypothetical protein DL93DRAFT_412813 [Clavulina sp. PMI_390]